MGGYLRERYDQIYMYVRARYDRLIEINLRMVMSLIAYGVFIYFFVILFSYMVVGVFEVHVVYFIVPVIFFFFFRIHMALQKRMPVSLGIARLFCLGFYFCLYTAIILIDVLALSGDGSIPCFPFALVALSIFYIDDFWVMVSFETALVAENLLLVSFFNGRELALSDFSVCMGAYMTAVFCYWIVVGLHADSDTSTRVLEEKSSTDMLTGLLNKRAFEERAAAHLENRKEGEGAALIIIDFDNFKYVNDEYGHLTGDEVLKNCGDILKSCFRAKDIVGRVGGDEFMVLVTDLAPDSRIEHRCDEVQHGLNTMIVGDARSFSASIGIVADTYSKQFKELYLLADDALYEAKARGKKQYVKWQVEKLVPPKKMAVYIATADEEISRRIREALGDRYEFMESSKASEALNRISLYQNHLEAVYFDYELPDISEEALRDYIASRPIFAKLPVHDVRTEL